ncbi:hypothetical protein PHMEG_00021646 [Phytophthora megakarya]|uniref:Uncharacterized protein n=1 Tax=Phytophthora megakarya TaxID=4795 RepID=A0A225VM17_9STRA|nr:hypothetical protein PHMEG_00021646 [Phytophthora megakarya]
MNAVIKGHQEMYDRFATRLQLADRRNGILTKEVNHARSEYLVWIQPFKKSHHNLRKVLSLTDPSETILILKLRERNRDLVLRVKRLEKTNSAIEDMDPEGLELDKIDWEAMTTDSQTHRALQAVYKLGLSDGQDRDSLADDIIRAKLRFADLRAEKLRKADEAAAASGLPDPPPPKFAVRMPSAPLAAQDSSTPPTSSPAPSVTHSTSSPSSSRSLSITRTGPPVVVTGAEPASSSPPSLSTPAGQSKSSAVPPSHSPPVSTPPAPLVSSGKKGKGKSKQQRTASDDEDVDFDGGDSSKDTPGEGRECPRLAPKRKTAMSSEFRSSFRMAGGSRSDIESLTSESLTGKSVKTPSSKSKKSRFKKAATKATPRYLSSDESVVSVSSESNSDPGSSTSEGSEAHGDEDGNYRAEEASPKSKAKPLPVVKADVKSSPKRLKKVSPKSAAKKKSSIEAKKSTASKKKSKPSPKKSQSSKKVKSQDVVDNSTLDSDLMDWISKYPELIKLAQRVSDFLTPYVSLEFTTVSA